MENFSKEEEDMLRAYLFTNPYGRTTCLYNQSLISGEELAPLIAAVSRTHIPMQDRVLEFLDKEKTEITRKMLPRIRKEMNVLRKEDGSLNVSKKAENFTNKWILKHGHNSIKEINNFIGYCENISDIAASMILGHPRNRPQAKSTRYVSYGKVLDMVLEDEDIKLLKENQVFIDHLAYLNSQYLRFKEELVDRIWNSEQGKAIREYQQKKDKPASDEKLRKNLEKFVLDYARMYLPACTRTSLGFSADARTLEEIITSMISSPREEDRTRGYELWEEAKKISPTLLGEKSHIKEDEWTKYKNTDFRREMRKRFSNIPLGKHDNPEVDIITPNDINTISDKFNAACAVYSYLDSPLAEIFNNLDEEDTKLILEKVHDNRDQYDNLDENIAHGGIMIEFVMGHHAYRDLFRHRRGSRSTQLLSTKLGFELPLLFKTFGLADEYIKDMDKAKEIYDKAAKQNPYIAEKVVPFGALRKALHSWHPNQIAYVGKLRSDLSKGNYAYVKIAKEMMDKITSLFPETMKYAKWSKEEYPEDLWKEGYEWYNTTQTKK
jgi:thymidylate synthase ThyX